MSVDEMLKCIAVVSANDCAVAMAEHLCGSEQAFVKRMNERALELGLKDTNFKNCTGLFEDDEHYTSAYDIAVMSRELISHELIKNYTTIWMDSIRGGEFGLSNTNKLVYYYDGCTGLKTGYTDNAGRTLVTCCERDGMRLIAVTLNDRSDWADHAALYEYGFAAFARKRAVARGEEYTLAPVRGGTQTSVLLAAGESFFYPVTAGEELLVSARLPEELTAPLTAGQAVGELIVSMDG